MVLSTGDMIDRYQIVERLGEGGMATVYKAYDTRLERMVAVKLIRSNMDAPEFIKRFNREARALGQLNHPHIVRVLDYGELGDDPYFVMEYMSGGTLKQKLGRPFAYQEAIRLLMPVADALCYAHEHKIVHRDVKPANILLTAEGMPMLSDFGVAKILQEGEVDLTKAGVGVGTPEYMAPEQGLGKAVDVRMDIYALGVVLYEMLTGVKPYQAETPVSVIMKVVSEPLPDARRFVPDLPDAVIQVLKKALAKKPEERYQNMEAFITALQALAGEDKNASVPAAQTLVYPEETQTTERHPRSSPVLQPVSNPQSSPLPPAAAAAKVKSKSGFPLWAILLVGGVGIGLVVLAIAGALGLWWLNNNTSRPTATALAAVFTQTPEAPLMAAPSPSVGIAATGALLEPTSTVEVSAAETQVFRDDFEDPNSGWEVDEFDEGSMGYGDGDYVVRAQERGIVMWGSLAKTFKDVTIEVDTLQVEAPANYNNDFGVMCRMQSNGDGYSFSISGDGFFAIQKATQDSFVNLVEWTSSDIIHQGFAENHLKVVCDGNYLALYVNNTLLAEVEDDQFSRGDVSLTATTYELEVTEIHFDNLIIYYH